MKQLVTILAAAAALAGCAGDPAGAGAAKGAAVDQGVAAPTPADVAVRVTAADKGKTVRMKVGQKIAVELVGVPTAGYLWAATDVPAFLSAAGTFGGPTSKAQLQPGFAGGSHWEILVFKADAAGQGVLKLAQKRPWESDEPPADEYAVTVIAE